ncbi:MULTISPECIES: hypothetical protein [Hyphomonas]|uniref:DUF3598 domain-containing protein n=1 Tax=Hyphomonas atlantica TaxID=1280948 RepID=A0A059DXL2_9PROT|nr:MULTISPECIES: hypothetical protein [Hyphomonas]KCZ58200.1 hypothetical protein HY36_10090 [Hyphomonas atlantica]MAM06717.1 DUF3598 domain-containing protein [Hyphomonas sp.]HAE93771.1 DUF3598 domain-containing protein [Hyphomonas atlantica]|tara:strand:+ start:228 stop:674 length:447 start_codon:yes stop_codon:yes gene_type:complete
MNQTAQHFPLLARGCGSWTGTYTHITPEGDVLDRHQVDTHSSFPLEADADFVLDIRNTWSDGRETRITLKADHRNNRLEWQDRLDGWMEEVDDRTVYLNFTYANDPSIRVCEMIQISEDGQSRARTWHWFKDDKLFKITLTNETRSTL